MYRTVPSLSFLFLSLLVSTGCTQYPHVVPPPSSPSIDDGWHAQFMIGLTCSPRSIGGPSIAPYASGWFGDRDQMFGAAITYSLIPDFVSYVRFVPIDDRTSASLQLHVAHLITTLSDGGLSPTLELDMGVHHHAISDRENSLPVALSGKVGLAWMAPRDVNWFGRWNLFDTSPHSGFLPVAGIDAFVGPTYGSVSWYPGLTRFMILEDRAPQFEGDTGISISARDVHLQNGLLSSTERPLPSDVSFRPSGSGESTSRSSDENLDYRRSYDLTNTRSELNFALIDADSTLLTVGPTRYRNQLFSHLLNAPRREQGRLHELQQLDTATTYYWVVRRENPSAGSEILYGRIIAVDTVQLFRQYQQSGDVIVKEQEGALERLDNVTIPFWNDLIFTIGGYWE